jgi:hypothetical protein
LLEAAYGAAELLLTIDPRNAKAKSCLRGKSRSTDQPKAMSAAQVRETEELLEDGYGSLKLEAEILRVELASPYFQSISEDQAKIVSNLQAISQGKVSSAASFLQPASVQEIAREVLANPAKATDLISEDFETLISWITSQAEEVDTDKIRQRLMKRRALLEAALPDSMQQNIAAAYRHAEREHLSKKYENTETMLGDKIEDIPKANFFVSEDNYAFDMEELAQAIEARNGVMRNPLSLQLFSESDIKVILEHPIGKRLKPLEEEQHRQKKGVRMDTIIKIEELSKIMLADQSMDGGPSRKGIGEFLAFVATLPSREQTTINQLKIPGVDKNTGQAFDYSIGESVADAKGGVTCYHKVRMPGEVCLPLTN